MGTDTDKTPDRTSTEESFEPFDELETVSYADLLQQWKRIEKLEARVAELEESLAPPKVLIHSYEQLVTLKDIGKLIFHRPVVAAGWKALIDGVRFGLSRRDNAACVQLAMESALESIAKERIAQVMAEHEKATQWLVRAPWLPRALSAIWRKRSQPAEGET